MIYLFKACFYGPACAEHNALFTTWYCGLYFKNRSALGFCKICSKNTDQIEKDIKKKKPHSNRVDDLGACAVHFLPVFQILGIPCSGC